MVNAGSGRVRFEPSPGGAGTWYDWAAGAEAAAILADGGLRIEFGLTTTSTTTPNWVSFNIGHPGSAAGEPGMRITDNRTDYGILFRGNGGTQRFDNGAATTTTATAPVVGQQHVVLDFAFNSFANGSPVNAVATVGGTQVDNYNFTWDDNAGQLYMELGTNQTGMLVDNLSISTLAGAGPAAAPPSPFTTAPLSNDADSGIAVGKFYTHVVDTAGTAAGRSVNGVPFERALPPSGGSAAGANWTISGANNGWSGSSGNVTGDIGTVLSDFWYNGKPQTTTLTGLVPGKEYQAVWYGRGFGGPGTRVQTITTDDGVGGPIIDTAIFDQNYSDNNNGNMLVYNYTAPASGILRVSFTPQNPANTFHQYAFTNEQTSAPSAQVSFLPITNDADSGIDSAKAYSHKLDFGNSAAATVNGVKFQKPDINSMPSDVSFAGNTGSRNSHGGNGNHNVSGAVADLMTDMFYNGGNAAGGTAELTLSGLTVGATYDTRIYTRQWGTGSRASIISYDTNGDGRPEEQLVLSEDDATRTPPGFGAANQAYALSYQFTAKSPEMRISFQQAEPNWAWHLYGLTNEVLSEGPGPKVANPGFEDATAFAWPGYGTPPGWTASAVPGVGVNQSDGPNNPFLNGQVPPDGTQVGFIQRDNNVNPRTISQTVTDLEAGKAYTVQYFESERGNGAGTVAHGWVTLGGETVVPGHDVTRKDNHFVRVVSQPYTATGTSAELLFANRGTSGDNTLLLDGIRVTRAVPVVANGGFERPEFGANGWSYAPAGADWTFTPGNSGIGRNGSPWINNGVAIEGRQAGYLQSTGSIEQTITGLEPGVTYNLAWNENRRGGYNPNSYRVLLDGVEVFYSPEGNVANGWSIESSRGFVAHNDSAVLRIETRYGADGLTGDRTVVVDDVHFNFLAEAPMDARQVMDRVALRNSGIDGDGDGIDDNYALVQAANTGPGTAYVTVPHPAWLPNSADSAWIGPTADATTTSAAGGLFVWETTFDLQTVDPDTLSVNGRFAADNDVLDILLNGQSLGIGQQGFADWTGFQLNEGFVEGLNTLQFVMENAPGGGVNAAGFRVEFNSAYGTIVPEPATITLLSLAIGGLGLRIRRRRRK